MRISKKHFALWIRWSVLIMIVHTIILGLVYDWEIFSTYSKTITLFKENETPFWGLPNELIFDAWYPRILDFLTFPIIGIFGLFIPKQTTKVDTKNLKEFLANSLLFGLVICLMSGNFFNFESDLAFGLVFGLVVGLVVGLLVGFLCGLEFYHSSSFVFGLVFGLGVGLGVGLVMGFVFGLVLGLVFGLATGLGYKIRKIHITYTDVAD